MSVEDIISKALIEYDTAHPTIEHLIKTTYYEGNRSNNDIERTTFKFYDKISKKLVLDTEVEILAIYYDKLNVWSWSWSQIGLTNSENYLSKEILIYALKLGSDLSYIKSILTTSRGTINDPMQIDINLAISSSVIKQPYIYPYVYDIEGSHLIYFFILLNKKQLDKISKQLI
ncbi:hypothetical protein QLL95_gp0870 [Cotonvirus japonicus]|uniref:Uncharacterized protein n=1 Tax=Cotonvirus japonicus TaxID=2811091 RepID=A0ABM7NSW8_9VIRU|nr:hypothetical protein QLL95_gp0870 [Cotonvirus japonicus]BCS83253.1 hypothetical protein [Cotonvirus japonicus]